MVRVDSLREEPIGVGVVVEIAMQRDDDRYSRTAAMAIMSQN